MWNKKIRFVVSLQIKNLQFRLKTWRQSREIAKAYGGEKPVLKPAIGIRTVIVIVLIGIASTMMYVSMHYGKNVFTAVKNIGRDVRTAVMAIKFEVPKLPIKAVSKVSAPETTHESITESKAANARAQIADTTRGAGTVSAASVSAPAGIPAPLPDIIRERLKAPGDSGFFSTTMNYCILINKADRTLYLLGKLSGKETWKYLERFPILMGRNDGQKKMAGDQRTPEGIYFITGRKEMEELNAMYGPLAYMLNYPNEEDRKAGRTGQGIWIHGTREDTTREATRGCVVLKNNDLLALSRYLQLGIGAPVVIVNANGLTAPEQALNFTQLRVLRERILTEYKSRWREFEGLISQWKQAWESRDINKYSRFYDSTRFFGEGMYWEAWREKKQRTFQTYSMISIGVEKICVSEFSESTAVILFMQRYESNLYRVQRPKKLSFFKSEGHWKIFKEETFSRQELLL